MKESLFFPKECTLQCKNGGQVDRKTCTCACYGKWKGTDCSGKIHNQQMTSFDQLNVEVIDDAISLPVFQFSVSSPFPRLSCPQTNHLSLLPISRFFHLSLLYHMREGGFTKRWRRDKIVSPSQEKNRSCSPLLQFIIECYFSKSGFSISKSVIRGGIVGSIPLYSKSQNHHMHEGSRHLNTCLTHMQNYDLKTVASFACCHKLT